MPILPFWPVKAGPAPPANHARGHASSGTWPFKNGHSSCVLRTKRFSEAWPVWYFCGCKHEMGPFPLKQTEKGVGVQDEAIICQWLRGCGAWLPRVTNEESALYSMQLWPKDWHYEHDSLGLHHPFSSDAFSKTGSFSESRLLSALLLPSQLAITSSQLFLLAASEPAMLNLEMQFSC